MVYSRLFSLCEPHTPPFFLRINYIVRYDCWLQYIEEAEELAMRGLRDNRHILDMITKELLENSRITGLVC